MFTSWHTIGISRNYTNEMWWLQYGFAFSDDQSKHITDTVVFICTYLQRSLTTYLKIDEFECASAIRHKIRLADVVRK